VPGFYKLEARFEITDVVDPFFPVFPLAKPIVIRFAARAQAPSRL